MTRDASFSKKKTWNLLILVLLFVACNPVGCDIVMNHILQSTHPRMRTHNLLPGLFSYQMKIKQIFNNLSAQ